MTKSTFAKTKAQIKSSRYYLFWGAATIAVVVGQIYIGNGYRRMAETGDAISADINLLIEVLTMPVPKTMPVPGPRYEPILTPPTRGYSDFHESDMVIR
tara:strand:- start:1583 stop:1879 length:297 start_codon:yes stop_codon:yes gene_type:complete